MFCPDCGKQIMDTARVCGYCGFKIPEKSSPPDETPVVKVEAPLEEPPAEVVEEKQAAPAPPPVELEKSTPKEPPAEVVKEKPEPPVEPEKTTPVPALKPKRDRKPIPAKTWGIVGIVIVLLGLAGFFIVQTVKRSQNIWVVRNSLAEPITWSAGQHEYAFKGVKDNEACKMDEFESESIYFSVLPFVDVLNDIVYLRPSRLSLYELKKDSLNTIHPDQETLPLISIWSDDGYGEYYTYSEAKEQMEACTLFFRRDGGAWIELDVKKVAEALFER
ncbi:zinc-ribbon domain-containing protein [Chloroflexota bacterium]